MTWRNLFARLRGAPARPPDEDGPADLHAIMSDWAGLLAGLGLSPESLRQVAAGGQLGPHFHYRHSTRPKKGGGRRDITEPDAKLKAIQRAIAARYLATEPHPAAVAFRPGSSIARHAWAHAGTAFIAAADLLDFFPSTAAWRVRRWWRGRVADDLADLLTALTTYCGCLPQGAPTSPALSNLVNSELDDRLMRLAERAAARYTRYCDDLAFSWRGGVPPSGFEAALRAALHEFGYALHPSKGWRLFGRADEPELTGVVLTRGGRVRLPDRLRRVMRSLARSGDPGDSDRLRGYQGYENMVVRRPRG